MWFNLLIDKFWLVNQPTGSLHNPAIPRPADRRPTVKSNSEKIKRPGHNKATVSKAWLLPCPHRALLSRQLPAGFVVPLTVVSNRGAPAENFD